MLAIGISRDVFFPPPDLTDEVRRLLRRELGAPFAERESVHGHDGSAIELEAVANQMVSVAMGSADLAGVVRRLHRRFSATPTELPASA